ncbi:MAG: class I SAM-dependent methyltransferase [Acidobacteriales bacterium]|nr:class I SAM-dependent methyltransferase [Terriglobales bacterium]
MGKGAPLRWLENQILRRHLHGRGIEIGALWRRFPLKSGTKVWYVDRHASDGLSAHYSEVGNELISPDVVADAAALPFEAASLDFIIASHVLEHLPFPLAALESWYRLLAPRGGLLLRVPDKRFTFDVKRARTPLAHLLQERENPRSFDKRAHFADWIEGVANYSRGSAEFAQELERLLKMDYSIHYHVWTTEDVRELLEHTRTEMRLAWQPMVFWGAHFYRKEIIALLQRNR